MYTHTVDAVRTSGGPTDELASVEITMITALLTVCAVLKCVKTMSYTDYGLTTTCYGSVSPVCSENARWHGELQTFTVPLESHERKVT